MKNNKDFFQADESEIEFALTEPRITGRQPFISETEFAKRSDISMNEITKLIFQWENLSYADYISNASNLQLDPFQMIVGGEVLQVHLKEVSTKSLEDGVMMGLLSVFPESGPGSPIVSDIKITPIDPKTVVVTYHRTELDKKGNPYDSDSAVILVNQNNAWKVATYTRRPLPEVANRK